MYMKVNKKNISKVDEQALLESLLSSFRIEGIIIKKEKADIILKDVRTRLQKSSL